jgi:RND family efflux transporter MFP subunit
MLAFIKKKYKTVLILMVFALIGYFGYQKFFKAGKNSEIKAAQVNKGTLQEELTISGNIQAEESVILRFQTSGMLSWVGVKEGDYVDKYQTIASLDKRELEKNLKKYLNLYMSERWDFEQTNDNYEGKVLSDELKRIIEKAQFDLENSVIDVEIKDLAIKYANLWTPIEGIVTKATHQHPGVNVTTLNSEYEVINPKSIYFSALADQTEVTSLLENMAGNLTLDSYPDETLSGNIKNISFTPKIDETGTVYEVKFIFNSENTGYKYRIGMAGDLSFVTKIKNDVLYLPIKYVKSSGDKKYVILKENGKEEKRFVQTGMETDNYIEITEGLTEGQLVFE